MPQGEKEYKTLLRRWLEKYGDTDPQKPHLPQGDPNSQPFPIPKDVSPGEDLRPWISTLEPMDTDLTKGQTAWRLLPLDVIKNGLTTPQQQTLLAAREKRRRLHDPTRMQKRREELASYFVRRYRMKKWMLAPFLEWADLMVKNQAEFQQLVNRRPSSRKDSSATSS